MRRYLALTIAGCSVACAPPALACRIYTPRADLSVFHEELPPNLPADVVAAQVQFGQPDDGWQTLRTGSVVQVRQVVQGSYRGDTVIIRDTAYIRITCYDPIRGDGSGLILGRPIGFENGILVLEPIFASPLGIVGLDSGDHTAANR